MLRKYSVGIVTLVTLACFAITLRAQDTLLQELYGRGVHAFFSGQYEQAHDLFTLAIDQGSQDPRVYYFRGLTYSRTGRPDEAESDFKEGARLEASGAAIQLDIGRALQRVQGRTRLKLENERYSAKLAVHLESSQRRRERYEAFQQNEERVIRDPAAATATPEVEPPATTDPTDPFGDVTPPTTPATDPNPMTPPDATPPNDVFSPPADNTLDPFADPGAAKPATSGEAENPFADPAVPVTVPPEDAADAGAPANDPFAEPPAAKPPANGADPADPFAEPPAAKPAMDPNDPFAEPPAKQPADNGADPNDPFAQPPAAQPPANKLPDEQVDPFADDPEPANGNNGNNGNDNDDPFADNPFAN